MYQAHQQYIVFYDDDNYVDPFHSSLLTGTNAVVVPVPDDVEGWGPILHYLVVTTQSICESISQPL